MHPYWLEQLARQRQMEALSRSRRSRPLWMRNRSSGLRRMRFAVGQKLVEIGLSLTPADRCDDHCLSRR